MNTPALKTQRLALRPWREDDLKAFAALNADQRVMEYFPSTLTENESNQMAERMQNKIDENGFGFFAAELLDTNKFIGFIGLNELEKPTFEAPFTPAIEIGWRLAYDQWGNGLATEGATACLKYGFEVLNFDEIVSFTAIQNMRSKRVMEKIGMHHDPKDDFDHPKLEIGHWLRRHVLYRLKVTEF